MNVTLISFSFYINTEKIILFCSTILILYLIFLFVASRRGNKVSVGMVLISLQQYLGVVIGATFFGPVAIDIIYSVIKGEKISGTWNIVASLVIATGFIFVIYKAASAFYNQYINTNKYVQKRQINMEKMKDIIPLVVCVPFIFMPLILIPAFIDSKGDMHQLIILIIVAVIFFATGAFFLYIANPFNIIGKIKVVNFKKVNNESIILVGMGSLFILFSILMLLVVGNKKIENSNEIKGTIVSIQSSKSDDGGTIYYAEVKYIVDGKNYFIQPDYGSSNFRVGKLLTVVYNTQQPEEAYVKSGVLIYFFIGTFGIAGILLVRHGIRISKKIKLQ